MIDTVVSPSGVLAEAIATATRGVPGVVRLCGGPAAVEVATYLPRRRVTGVRVTANDVEVHVVASWVASLPKLADDVRSALSPLVAGRSVDVFVDDVEEPQVDDVGRDGAAPDVGVVEADGAVAWAKTVI